MKRVSFSGIRTRYPCGGKPVLYHLSYSANWHWKPPPMRYLSSLEYFNHDFHQFVARSLWRSSLASKKCRIRLKMKKKKVSCLDSDLNPGPSDYEQKALPPELLDHSY